MIRETLEYLAMVFVGVLSALITGGILALITDPASDRGWLALPMAIAGFTGFALAFRWMIRRNDL